eukprot:gene41864-51886_t
MSMPRGIWVDPGGDRIYFTDSNRLRLTVLSKGSVSDIAGIGAVIGSSGDGGPPQAAFLNSPYGVWSDTAGIVFFADSGNTEVRAIDTSRGLIAAIAGSTVGLDEGVYLPVLNGSTIPALKPYFINPCGMYGDIQGSLYVVDNGNSM